MPTRPITAAMLLLPLLLLAQPAASPTEAEAARIRCIAALAIVATEQERGAAGWEQYPRLAPRGVEWAIEVEEAVAGDGSPSREQFRALVTAEIAAFQQAPEGTLRAAVDGCVAQLDAAVPPPGVVECAAMTRLAYEAIHAREGLSGAAKDMATIASVLDHRAREQLRSEGNSDSDVDRTLTLAREALAGSDVGDFDLTPCFVLARP